MEKETFERFNREMRSFFALLILNVVGAGLAISFGIAWGVTNIRPIITGQSIQLPQLALGGLVVAGCVIALRWLIISAETFDGFDDLIDVPKKLEAETNVDTLTGLIVQSIALYREKRVEINKLKLGSKITGAFFLLSAAFQIINLLSIMGSASLTSLAMSVTGLVLCLVLGLLGLVIPSSIDRFMGTWDRRLESSDEAVKKLESIMEGQ